MRGSRRPGARCRGLSGTLLVLAVSFVLALGCKGGGAIDPNDVHPPGAGSGGRPDELIRWLAAAAIVLTAVNMFGGFAVTRRMLAMFRK